VTYYRVVQLKEGYGPLIVIAFLLQEVEKKELEDELEPVKGLVQAAYQLVVAYHHRLNEGDANTNHPAE
jgi:hypothetical protein